MKNKDIFIKAAGFAMFFAVMYLAIQIALALGIQEKSWWTRSWEFVVGGSVGAIAGVAFFIIFGAIGWVCGALYGALGVIELALGGALGGLGLGALANIIRNPGRYDFAWPTIVITMLIGGGLAKIASDAMVKRLMSTSRINAHQMANSSNSSVADSKGETE